jgi:hypothetical protein
MKLSVVLLCPPEEEFYFYVVFLPFCITFLVCFCSVKFSVGGSGKFLYPFTIRFILSSRFFTFLMSAWYQLAPVTAAFFD